MNAGIPCGNELQPGDTVRIQVLEAPASPTAAELAQAVAHTPRFRGTGDILTYDASCGAWLQTAVKQAAVACVSTSIGNVHQRL